MFETLSRMVRPIRVAVKTRQENEMLLEAFTKVVEKSV